MLALINLDGSDESFNALEYFISKFSPERWEVILLSVVDIRVIESLSSFHPESGIFRPSPVLIGQIEEQMEKEAKNIVERGRRLAEERGFKAEAVVEKGSPHDKILEIARKRGVDLIVMGSRGQRRLLRRMLGSISSYVVNNSDIPVLVVPLQEKSQQ